MLDLHGLGPLKGRQVYQVWVAKGQSVRPSSNFIPDPSGRAMTAVDGHLTAGTKVMVTREPHPGRDALRHRRSCSARPSSRRARARVGRSVYDWPLARMEASTEQRQTCYRHPNRETGVSCSNCGRPICPDCMTSTSVGMRCPECARADDEGEGRRRRLQPHRGKMPATIALIAINVIVFIIELAGGGSGSLSGGGTVIHDFGLRGPDVANGDWWRVITGGFLHAGFLHLLLNMYVLYVAGSILEPGIGTPRFLGIYFVSLIAGSLGALIVDPNSLTVGASGAIFGLMAAVVVIARGRGRRADRLPVRPLHRAQPGAHLLDLRDLGGRAHRRPDRRGRGGRRWSCSSSVG